MPTTKVKNTHAYSFYMDNIPKIVLDMQKRVFDHFEIPLKQLRVHSHCSGIDFVLSKRDWDSVIFFDIDCIPTTSLFMQKYLYAIEQNKLIGPLQGSTKAGYRLLYAAPAALGMSRELYEFIGKPSSCETGRHDVCGYITEKCRQRCVDVEMLRVTSCDKPMWHVDEDRRGRVKLGIDKDKEWREDIWTGLGTTFADCVYHQYLSRLGNYKPFIQKCNDVLVS